MPSADISAIRVCRTGECGKLRERALEDFQQGRLPVRVDLLLGMPSRYLTLEDVERSLAAIFTRSNERPGFHLLHHLAAVRTHCRPPVYLAVRRQAGP